MFQDKFLICIAHTVHNNSMFDKNMNIVQVDQLLYEICW